MRISKNDQELLAEAYAKIVENEMSAPTQQAKMAKLVNTSKAGHLGNLSVYELNPKLQETSSEWLGIATAQDGKVSIVDPDSEFMNSVELPALKDINLNKTTPEEILGKLGYKVADQSGQEHLPFKG